MTSPVEQSARQQSTHSEIIDQLVAIGQALGFEAEKERPVATGAVVDVIWRARIANLGVVMYIFEVQCHGGIDSLILNLMRAQKNQSVQRLIAVSDSAQLSRIRSEVENLSESFRNAMSYWDSNDVQRSYDLVSELFTTINNLGLIKSEFDIRR